jgi:hypothetical protein
VLNPFAGVAPVARVPVTRVDFVRRVARFVVVLGDPGVVGVIRVVCVEEFPAFPELV